MNKKQSAIAIAILLLLMLAGAGIWYANRPAPAAAVTAGAVPPDTIGADEHVFGSAKAPVTVIEYFAQVCSACAYFDQTTFPLVKTNYIDTGKVRYVMRLFPINALDGPAYKLDLCVPPEQWLSAVDLLFRNQKEWDSYEYHDVTDSHAGLIKMARILGLSAEQADACMNSTTHDAAINKVAADATARYHPQHTPTFIIDGKNVEIPQLTWEEFRSATDAALAAKGAK